MIIFHHSLFFLHSWLWHLSCVWFLFFIFTSSGCCYREHSTQERGKFTERVLSGPCSVHGDQMLPRCGVCVCVYITLHFSPLPLYQHQSCCPRLLQSPGPQCALWVFSLWALVHPSTCRENKSCTGFYRTPGEYTKKKKIREQSF